MTTKLRFIPALLFILVMPVLGDPVVVWPPPASAPPGTPPALFSTGYFGWQQYFYDHLVKSKTTPVDLLFDGDSITDFWQTRGHAVWQQHFGALNAFDFGISADRIQNLLWRLNHGELDGLHPKLIVLMIGTNNLGVSAENIEDGIKNLVEEYRKRCPESHILLLGIFPRIASPSDPVRATITQINQVIAKLDDGKNITFLDIGAKFLQPDGTLTAEIMPDFLHPSEKGYGIWADAIQPIIDQYCPKSAAMVAPPAPPPVLPPLTPVTWPLPPWPAGMTNDTLYPVPQWTWSFQTFTGHLYAASKGPADLIFDGDEMTERWLSPDGGQAVWAAHYGAIKALNYGIGFDQVQNVLWRARHGEFDRQNPKLIMLQGGINNTDQDPKDVAAGMKLILNEIETRCPGSHILLLGIFPRVNDPKSDYRAWIDKINAVLATYDDGKRVTFMDVGKKFLNPDGTVNSEAMPDARQLTAKAYQIWADAIQPIVDQYIPKTATK